MEIFGLNITRKGPVSTEKSVVPPSDSDGALDTIRAGGGYYGTYLDLDGASKTEAETIKRYRDTSLMADVDMAIEDIVNQAISALDGEPVVKLILDDVEEISASIKKDMQKEYNFLMKKLNFKNRAHDLFRRWYIDGRLYFHKVIDTAKPAQGITDIRYIDPRKIKKVREILKQKDPVTGVDFIKGIKEYFVFNDKGLGPIRTVTVQAPAQGLKMNKDSITFVPSGLVDPDNNMVLSYLHKAIKPANQLRMMENALVIYRLARAPERRIFYIDVGNLPKIKAEQYLKDIMNKYRNKIVYDASTGEIRDDKKYMSMLEDFWLPRREGGKGTQIETLPGGHNLGEIADIEYFQRKLYESLNVPVSRLQQTGGLNFGRVAEITRDELKFIKFVQKLQARFTELFQDLLKTQLILKKIITEDDWEKIRYDIRYEFAEDAFYGESKNQEVLRVRAELVGQLDPFVGKYFTKKYIQQEILHLTEEQIEEFEIENEEAAAASTDYSEPNEDPNAEGNILPKGQPVPEKHPDAEANGPAALEKIKGEAKVKAAIGVAKARPKPSPAKKKKS